MSYVATIPLCQKVDLSRDCAAPLTTYRVARDNTDAKETNSINHHSCKNELFTCPNQSGLSVGSEFFTGTDEATPGKSLEVPGLLRLRLAMTENGAKGRSTRAGIPPS